MVLQMRIPLVTDIFAFLMRFIMTVITPNFALAIVIFTVVTKILMFPLQLKAKKGLLDQQRIQPKAKKLQKKYGNDKQRLNEELQKLYKQEKVSMMGGCLPTLLVLVVLFGLYGVVYRPLTYLMDLNSEKVKALAAALGMDSSVRGFSEITAAKALSSRIGEFVGEYPKIFAIDFNFFGLDLSGMPSYKPFNLLALLPIISALTAFGASWLNRRFNPPSGGAEEQAASTGKTMMIIMPLISLWIGFMLPSGVTLYWIVNSILSSAQEPILKAIAEKKYGKFEPEPEEEPKPVYRKKKPVVYIEDDTDYENIDIQKYIEEEAARDAAEEAAKQKGENKGK
jgi:YidC/Oxa1 family membrane protein insertase